VRHLRHLPPDQGQEGLFVGVLDRRIVAAVAIVALFAAAVVFRFSVCPVAALLGIPCPGCGLLRATLSLAQGHVTEALHFHPLVFVVVPSALGAAVHVASGRPVSRALEWTLATIATVLVALLVVVWVARFHGAFGGPVPVRSLWSAFGP
jgi:hypothetical protein